MSEAKNVSVANEMRLEQLDKKFRIRPAHERDSTAFSFIVYVLLHVAIIAFSIYFLWNMRYDNDLKKYMVVLVSIVFISLNEIFKGLKMEYFSGLLIMSRDNDKPMEERKKIYTFVPKAFLFTLGFWAISILTIGYIGYREGVEVVPFNPLPYDETLKASAQSSIYAVNFSIANQSGSKAIRELTNFKNGNVTTWNNHKKEVDMLNATKKTGSDQEGYINAIQNVLIGLLLEILLFAARFWHEKDQYEVLKSQKKLRQKEAEKSQNTEGSKNVATKPKYDFETIARRQAAIIEAQNKKIQDLENRDNFIFTALNNEVKLENKDLQKTHNGAGKS